MTGTPDPHYDLRGPLYQFAPGIVATREIDDALATQYAANNFTPLTQAQVLTIVGPLPPLLTTIPWPPSGDRHDRGDC